MLRTGLILLLSATPHFAAENPRVEFAFGVLAECRGEQEKATSCFESARLADPIASALVKRGVARLLSSGNRSEAIQMFREFAAARSGDLTVQLDYVDFLTENGKGDSAAEKIAIDTLVTALAKHPGDVRIIRRLAPLDPSRAKEWMEQLPIDDPNATMLYAELARTLMDTDDEAVRDGIEKRFRSAFAADPGNPRLARTVSEFFRSTARLEEAINILETHTSHSPWSLDLRVRLGVLDFSAKRDEAGEKTLKELLAIHPRHALAHQSLAKFYRLRGKPDLATHHAGELLNARGGSSSEFIKLADEYITAGKPREARLFLEKAIFQNPDSAELSMKLAIATHQDPETRSRAPRLFREAEALAQDEKITDPAFLTASAEALIEAGQSKAAEERLRAAIRAYPTDAKKETAATLRRLATLWTTENRNAEAAKALNQRADSLDPKP